MPVIPKKRKVKIFVYELGCFVDSVYFFSDMKCPRCVQSIHRSAEQCPHCGFSMSDLDDQYGEVDVVLQKLNDVAGVLRVSERQKVKKWFLKFEQKFPQLFFTAHFCELGDVSEIRPYGIWLLNRGIYSDVDASKSNDGGILLLVDLNSKTAYLAYGYLLDVYFKEKDTFNILAAAHPHFLKEDYMGALEMIVKHLSQTLQRRSRKSKRNPEKYQRLAGWKEVGDEMANRGKEGEE